jgi:hypothetical protein
VKDCNGNNVNVGDKVMPMSGYGRGKIGTVRVVGTYPGRNIPAIRADDGTGDELDMSHTWSSWLKSEDFAVVNAKGGAK